MSHRRSISNPRISSSWKEDLGEMSSSSSPYAFAPAHSRESSGASLNSSPATSTFSNRNHNRWSSSSSSLVPDSPINVAKSPLHDLLEEPAEDPGDDQAEREDDLSDLPSTSLEEIADAVSAEPFCICDTTFCEHRQTPNARQSFGLATPTPDEWDPGDDINYFYGADLPGDRVSKRRRSGEYAAESLTSRLTRRLPSLSKRWKNQASGAPSPGVGTQSAPASSAPSIRRPSRRQSRVSQTEHSSTHTTPPFSPIDARTEDGVLSRSRAGSSARGPPMRREMVAPPPDEYLSDSELPEGASTPLLPPMMPDHKAQSLEELQSPLQSPTVADAGNGYVTPPLSSHPSAASLITKRPNDLLVKPNADVPPLDLSQPFVRPTGVHDPWGEQLGHANFHIYPEPRPIEGCDARGLNRLRDDWASARMEYMRIAQRVSEHYGPTSQTLKLTEAKWRDIDEKWKRYHEDAHSLVQANGGTALYQPLAETQRPSQMPEIHDSHQKFPLMEGSAIVGPMVTYAKIQRRPSRKAAFLKLFTDPASLINGRAQLGLRR
nr:uncharacterized protein LOC112019679 [Quercus suber]POF16533.1 hypothetical protein CFP56_24051 [Quercus suber]